MLQIDRYSEIGKRSTNQDRQEAAAVGQVHCVIVADGVGGLPGGSEASSIAIDALIREFRSNPLVGRETLETMFHEAHIAVKEFQKANPERQDAETTAVVLLLDEGKTGKGRAAWGHVGDSRLYVLRAGAIKSITRDHSLAALEGTLYSRQSGNRDNNPDASKLMQAVGGEREPTPEIVDNVDVRAGDRFLLCTDGFWQAISDKAIEDSSLASANPTDWLAAMRNALRPDQLTDNHSAIVVQLGLSQPHSPMTRLRGASSDPIIIWRVALIEAVVIFVLLCWGVIEVVSTRGTSGDVQRLDSELQTERARVSVLEGEIRESQSPLQSQHEATKDSPPEIDLFNVTNASSADDPDDWIIEWDLADVDRVEVYVGADLISQELSGSVHRTVKAPTWVRIVAVTGTYTTDKSRLITPVTFSTSRDTVKNDGQKHKNQGQKEKNDDQEQ